MHVPPGEEPIDRLRLVTLELRCREETRRYLREQPSNPQFCLEIFRRALRRSTLDEQGRQGFADESARELLVHIYSEHIRANIYRRAFQNMSMEDLVQQVWLRFWQADLGSKNGLDFVSLEAALSYLRLITFTTTIDEKRREIGLLREKELDEGAVSQPDQVFDDMQQKRFRERCYELLSIPLERRIFWMRYSLGLPPRKIASTLLEEQILLRNRTPTARLVSDLLEQLIKRLSTDPEIRDLLQGD